MSYQDFLKLIEVLGILAFSMTGIFEARRLKMDIVGTYSVAMITAFGGGTLRDLFLQRYPLFWIHDWPYGVVILILSVVSVAILRQIKDRKSKGLILAVTICDALGLGLFSVLGAVYSLQAYPGLFFIAVIMGVITGCFGGVIRDIIGNKVPTVFQKSQLYATCSLARLRHVPASCLAGSSRRGLHPLWGRHDVRRSDARREIQRIVALLEPALDLAEPQVVVKVLQPTAHLSGQGPGNAVPHERDEHQVSQDVREKTGRHQENASDKERQQIDCLGSGILPVPHLCPQAPQNVLELAVRHKHARQPDQRGNHQDQPAAKQAAEIDEEDDLSQRDEGVHQKGKDQLEEEILFDELDKQSELSHDDQQCSRVGMALSCPAPHGIDSPRRQPGRGAGQAEASAQASVSIFVPTDASSIFSCT